MKEAIDKFRNLGITAHLTANEATKIKMVNTIFLISIVFCSFLGILTILFGYYSFSVLVLILLSMIAGGMYLMFKRAYQKVYNFLITGLTIFFVTSNLFFGNISENRLIFLMLVYLVYVIYESNKTRLVVVTTMILLYFLTLYLHFVLPLEYRLILPTSLYIKELLFVFYVVWIGYLINHYHDDVVQQKVKQQNLIQELQNKNQRIKEVSAELERFNHIASHDLKSPLRNIISFLGLAKLKLRKEDFEALEVQMTFVNNATEQMDTLINDVISYSKIEHDPITTTSIDLSTVIDQVYNEIKPIFNEKEIKLEIKDLPNIIANKEEIKTVFYHLIKNGFQYNTSSSATIQISSSIVDDFTIIKIKDNGIGIEEKYQEQVFEFFKRLHTYSAYKGSGLGLSIANKIIQKYNGTIEVESKIDEGSTFMLFLNH